MNWSKSAGWVPAGAAAAPRGAGAAGAGGRGAGPWVGAPRSVGWYGPRPHWVEALGTAGHAGGPSANTMFLFVTPCRLPQLLAITTDALPFGATSRKSRS